MTLNQSTTKGKWREIRGNLQETWGQLTSDELSKTKGELKAIGGLIQQQYGRSKELLEKSLSKFFQTQEPHKAVKRLKKSLKKRTAPKRK